MDIAPGQKLVVTFTESNAYAGEIAREAVIEVHRIDEDGSAYVSPVRGKDLGNNDPLGTPREFAEYAPLHGYSFTLSADLSTLSDYDHGDGRHMNAPVKLDTVRPYVEGEKLPKKLTISVTASFECADCGSHNSAVEPDRIETRTYDDYGPEIAVHYFTVTCQSCGHTQRTDAELPGVPAVAQ